MKYNTKNRLRLEELLQVVGNDTLPNDPNFVELDLLSDWVAEYEEKYHPASIASQIRKAL